MRKVEGMAKAFRAFVDIAAPVAIVVLLIEERADPRDLRTIAFFLIAGATLASVVQRTRLAFPGKVQASIPGEILRLESFGLTLRERQLVLEYLGGKQMKEISRDHGLSASTVRNNFSSVYRKLGISGETELSVLGERYKIE